MGVAIHAPHSTAHLGIKHNPVGCIQPFAWHSGSRTLPTRATIFAAEKTDVCVGKELPVRVERIEVNTVDVGDIEPGARPLPV